MNLQLLFIGKPRSREANLLAQEYTGRIKDYCKFEMVQLKDEKAAAAYGRAFKVVLDPAGEQLTSRELAAFLEKTTRETAFFVGGAEGFSDEFRARADRLISLSKMTLPHELARVILAEQIYRAFTILRGHPYPR